MANIIGSMVAHGLLIALCVYVARTWVRWSRSDLKLSEPQWRSSVTTFGFGASTASLVVIVALAAHALTTGGLPHYHFILLLAFRVGFLTALCGIMASLIGTGQLEVPTIACSLVCLLIWFVEAMAQ
jgi:hypothetical protein